MQCRPRPFHSLPASGWHEMRPDLSQCPWQGTVVLLMLVLCIPHEHNNVIKMQFAAIYFEHKASKMFKSCSLSWSLLLLMVIVMCMWMWMWMRMSSWNPDQELTCMTFWALVCECEGCIHIRFKQSKIIKFYYALAACLEWPR